MAEIIKKTEKEWELDLTAEEFAVCRQKGTEKPFSGEYYDSKEEGVYLCCCCGEPLFSSSAKYDSGSGWPSFFQSLNHDAVKEELEGTHGMTRTEILCNRCGSHLGHIFPDGPDPTGLRYCVNSLSLKLEKKD
ncbi:MAG: peptide-methionine (R)-S-oxide reductase MsrB [Gammaproteobacteria bacterium]|nr:peptide-methionine (R)-S-oxide reductase MsrB [Gammaproteobacteria bacterium]